MSVAIENQNMAVGFPFRGSLILRGAATRIEPRFHLAFIPTAWGICGAVWDQESRLCRIMTPGLRIADLRMAMLKQFPLCNEVIGDGHGNFHPEVVPEWFSELVRQLIGYYSDSLRGMAVGFEGQWAYWRTRLDWSQVTPFQRQVLEHTATVTRGKRQTYGQVAKAIGKGKASRAVGAALGANPWPVLVPCHRVVGATGELTGFSAPGGVTTKKRMLEHERR